MEDFVSFDLAKKLKEKGFRIPCRAHYNSLVGDVLSFNITVGNIRGSNVKCLNDASNIYTDAPSISQVLKWLREEKEIMVSPIYSPNTSKWYCVVVNADSLEQYKLSLSDSYELAALAGIEYVLDNFI